MELNLVEEKENVVVRTRLIMTKECLKVERVSDRVRVFRRNSSSEIYELPVGNILSVSINNLSLQLNLLPSLNNKLTLINLNLSFSLSQSDQVTQFALNLTQAAYPNHIKQNKRILVLVNKFGGSGKADTIWKQTIQPILLAANCIIDQRYTGAANTPENAYNIAAKLNLDDYDVIVPIAGDGVIHETLNGFASRVDALEALLLPISPIPAGSGNALAVNLFGPKSISDLGLAALNVIKGQPIALDLVSITQGEKRIYSFLSAATGLSAELDLGTEHLRYMGDFRFLVGYLHGALTLASYPIEISINIVESNKQTLVDNFNQLSPQKTTNFVPPIRKLPPGTNLSMPALIYGNSLTPLPNAQEIPLHNSLLSSCLLPGWHTIKTDVQYVYAGKLPYVSLDMLEFPLAGTNDNSIDLVIVPPLSRIESLSAVKGSESAAFFNSEKFHYFKCKGFRFTPLGEKGFISIDGEKLPFERFQAENHEGLGRVLSLKGRWMGMEVMKL